MFSVPFFGDFAKQTKGYFRECCPCDDKYDLGRKVDVSFPTCLVEGEMGGKFNLTGGALRQSYWMETVTSWGKLKLVEDVDSGSLKVKVNAPGIARGLDYESTHKNSCVEVGLKYRPQEFYNVQLKGAYCQDAKRSSRVCFTTISMACGDEAWNLSVGGDVKLRSEQPNDDSPSTFGVACYRLGFLYTPCSKCSYSVIYTPDRESDGLRYDLRALRKVTDKYDVAVKVTGKVDTEQAKGSLAPVLSLAQTFQVSDAISVQGFFSSNREYGFAYSNRLSTSAHITLGVAGYLAQGIITPKFGFKLSF